LREKDLLAVVLMDSEGLLHLVYTSLIDAPVMLKLAVAKLVAGTRVKVKKLK